MNDAANILSALTITATLVRRSCIGAHYEVAVSHPEGGSLSFGAIEHRHGGWCVDRTVKAPWHELPSELATALRRHVESGNLAA